MRLADDLWSEAAAFAFVTAAVADATFNLEVVAYNDYAETAVNAFVETVYNDGADL
jgi:hypothetical protein